MKTLRSKIVLFVTVSFLSVCGLAQPVFASQTPLDSKLKSTFEKAGWDLSSTSFVMSDIPIMQESHWLRIRPDLKKALYVSGSYEYVAIDSYQVDGLRLAEQDQPQIYYVVRTNDQFASQIIAEGIRIYPKAIVRSEQFMAADKLVYLPSASQKQIQKDVKAFYQEFYAQAKNDTLLRGFFGGIQPDGYYAADIAKAKQLFAKHKWTNVSFQFYKVSILSDDDRRDKLFDIATHKSIHTDSVRVGLIDENDLGATYAFRSGINFFFYSENLFRTKKGNVFAIDFCVTFQDKQKGIEYAWLVVKPQQLNKSGKLNQKIYSVDTSKNEIASYVDAVMGN